MLKSLFIILFLLPLTCWAQYTIIGKVQNLTDKKPVIKASIFLSNTTVGTATADDGSYVLSNIKPGQYQLVVSAIGFETAYQSINVNQNFILPVIELLPKSIALMDVVIKPDAEWENNYTRFKQEFFGYTAFAQQCRILNPELLDLTYNRYQQTLVAKSADALIIENMALGYRLRYQLKMFQINFSTGHLYYEGTVLFENLKGSSSQLRKWNKNRRQAYFGSSEHYLRSALKYKDYEDGFQTLKLIRQPNPDRPPDSLIKAKMKKLSPHTDPLKIDQHLIINQNDSLNYWLSKSRLPKTISYLVRKPVMLDSLIRRTDQNGIMALGYKDYLYVVYTKKKGDSHYNEAHPPTTIVGLTDQYIFFDRNGVILNPSGVIFEGDWGTDRIAKLLPVDYEPDTEKP